jgi:hypothetical protein
MPAFVLARERLDRYVVAGKRDRLDKPRAHPLRPLAIARCAP